MKINHVCINVTDLDEAIEYYVKVLGFKLLTDVAFGEGGAMRWVEIGTGKPNSACFSLMKVAKKQGKSKSIICTFDVEDCVKKYNELKKKGVAFVDAPKKEVWGRGCMFVDPFNNLYYMCDEIKG